MTNPTDEVILSAAYNFADQAHAGQARKTGEPYIEHVKAVGDMLLEKYGQVELAAAGYLHDTVEDVEGISIETIHDKFGRDIGFLVDAMNKRGQNFHIFPDQVFTDKIERILWAGMYDVRVFLLKLADRKHNLQTLDVLSEKKQIPIAFETQAIYEPLRKILDFDNPERLTVEQAQEKLWQGLDRSQFYGHPKKLKKYLLNVSFAEFDNKLFDLVYLDSAGIVWSLDDYSTYERIIKLEDIDEKIGFIEIDGSPDDFCAKFRVKKGVVLPETTLQTAGYDK